MEYIGRDADAGMNIILRLGISSGLIGIGDKKSCSVRSCLRKRKP